MTKKRFIKLLRSYGHSERRIKKAVEEVQASNGRVSYQNAILVYLYHDIFTEVGRRIAEFFGISARIIERLNGLNDSPFYGVSEAENPCENFNRRAAE